MRSTILLLDLPLIRAHLACCSSRVIYWQDTQSEMEHCMSKTPHLKRGSASTRLPLPGLTCSLDMCYCCREDFVSICFGKLEGCLCPRSWGIVHCHFSACNMTRLASRRVRSPQAGWAQRKWPSLTFTPPHLHRTLSLFLELMGNCRQEGHSPSSSLGTSLGSSGWKLHRSPALSVQYSGIQMYRTATLSSCTTE